jgi:hypothetical protein
MIAASERPARAAGVANPARSECPAKSPQGPAPAARPATISASARPITSAPVTRCVIHAPIDPPKDAPALIAAILSSGAAPRQDTSPLLPPNGTGTLAPAPSPIRLRAPDRQHDPLGLETQVGDLDRDELAAPQSGRPADEPMSSSARSRSPRISAAPVPRCGVRRSRARSSAAAPRRVGGGCRARPRGPRRGRSASDGLALASGGRLDGARLASAAARGSARNWSIAARVSAVSTLSGTSSSSSSGSAVIAMPSAGSTRA